MAFVSLGEINSSSLFLHCLFCLFFMLQIGQMPQTKRQIAVFMQSEVRSHWRYWCLSAVEGECQGVGGPSSFLQPLGSTPLPKRPTEAVLEEREGSLYPPHPPPPNQRPASSHVWLTGGAAALPGSEGRTCTWKLSFGAGPPKIRAMHGKLKKRYHIWEKTGRQRDLMWISAQSLLRLVGFSLINNQATCDLQD